MAATTTLLGLVTPTQGTLSGTWGDTVNYGISDYVDIAVAGTLTLTGDGAVTLANTTGSSSGSNITSTLAGAGTVTAQFSTVRVSGTTTTKVVTGPSYSKTYLVDNASSFAVTFKASAQTGVSISPNEKVYVYYNATDYVKVGGGGITYGAVKTTTYTAVANDGVLTNTTSAAFTVNLPATPLTGTQVFIADSAGTWATNNLTIGRNGSTIAGSATDLVCDINSVSIQCIYDGTTWDIFAQIGANDTAVVTLNGTQTLTNKTLTAPVLTAPVLGTPASGTVTNLTGTASININGTVGATTANTGNFTTITSSSTVTHNGGTANGVTYLNGSKVLTSGSDFIFNSNGLGIGAAPNTSPGSPYYNLNVGTHGGGGIISGGTDTYFTNNLYITAGNNYFAYTGGSAYGSYYNQSAGNHTWKSSTAAGTGGNVATLNTLMTLNSNGALALFGGVSATGVGITFPATQSASSNANTLDDYEEGTWTPVIVGSTTAGTASYSTQIGRYTRIGRMVQFECAVEYSGGTGTGNLRVSGLPFSCQGNSFPPTTCNLDGITLSANNYASPYLQSGDTYILMSQNPTGGGSRTAIAYDASGGILVAGTYSTS